MGKPASAQDADAEYYRPTPYPVHTAQPDARPSEAPGPPLSTPDFPMFARALACLLLAAPFAAAEEKGTPVKLSGLAGTAPAAWKSEKPANRLRSYQFKLPSGDKDYADAEVAVFPESSPDNAKNFERWKSTIVPPDGLTPDEAAKVGKMEIGKAKVATLDANGTWKYKERPQDPKSKEELRAEYRVIWVVIETPDETTHIRLSGPLTVVEKHRKDFEAWLKGLK